MLLYLYYCNPTITWLNNSYEAWNNEDYEQIDKCSQAKTINQGQNKYNFDI